MLSLYTPSINAIPIYTSITALQALELNQVTMGSIVYCTDTTYPGQYIAQNSLPTSGTYFESDTGEFWWILLSNNLIAVENSVILTQNLPSTFNANLATGYTIVGNNTNQAEAWPCDAMIYALSTYTASGSASSYSMTHTGVLSTDDIFVWPTTAQATANGKWIGTCSNNTITFQTYNISGTLTPPGSTFTANIVIYRNTP